jgi:ElaB/YqjD/DUF883 family membrane-anchored ribosome-binding protein
MGSASTRGTRPPRTGQQPTTQQPISDKANQVASQAGQQVGQKASQAIDQVQQQAEQQKGQAAGRIESLADSFRRSGEQLRQQQPMLADGMNQVADRVEGVSDYLRTHDVRTIVNDVQDYARREPYMVIGGALALGFLAARVLKSVSSSGSSYQHNYQPSYGTQSEPGWRTGGESGLYESVGEQEFEEPPTAYVVEEETISTVRPTNGG